MKILYSVYQEMKKMFMSYTFILVIVATALINISGEIFTEAITSKSYNLVQLIMMNDSKKNEFIEMYNITFSRIFLQGSQGYLWMFASALTSAPFVVLMCAAKKNNNIRFEIYRLGKITYVLSKGIAAIITGGMVMCLGYVLYALILKFSLPVGEVLPLSVILKRLFEMFLFGMSSVVMTFILSGIMRNKYLVLCIPFMANYLIKGIMENPKLSKNEIVKITNPVNLSYLFSYENSQMKKIICFWLFIVIFGFVFYYIVLSRRCDCGE